MTDRPFEELASRLINARKSAIPLSIHEVSAVTLDLDAAHKVLAAMQRLERLEARVQTGWKIGLTSQAALNAFGAEEPMVGSLYADAELPSSHTRFSYSQSIDARIEGELMIEIGSRCAVDATDEELLASIAAVYPAFEIADSRIRDWPNHVNEAAADNACCGWYVKARNGCSPYEIDLSAAKMVLRFNGETVSEGSSAECLGGALETYRWFLRHSLERGYELRVGDLILTGALGAPVPLEPSGRYELSIEQFASLGLEIIE